MNFKTVTIKDIAKDLGVSAATVSRSLKDSFEISQTTKEKVLACARKLGYRPNVMAQGLQRGKGKSIVVVISTIDNPFFAQVIGGIESFAYSKGYNVSITQTHESQELEKLYVQDLAFRFIDGLLISPSTETDDISHLKELHQKGLPIVFFDRVSDELSTHKVVVDNFKAAYEATTQLIKAGYRRIAHITSSVNTSIVAERLKGYQSALRENDIAINEQYIKYCSHGGKNPAEVEQVLNELFFAEDRPDALFTASDRISTTAFPLLHKLGWKIPDDIALLGFTNTHLTEILNPSLSSVYQPGAEMGKKAAEMLISLIESSKPVTEFKTVVFPAQVCIRNSSGQIKPY